MSIYISILRGINVSGHNLIKMDDLRKSYKSLGFDNIMTYVQSGNIVFTTDETEPGTLAQTIHERIGKDFGFDVPVLVLPVEKLERIIGANPFLRDQKIDKACLHVTFLAEKPGKYDLTAIDSKRRKDEEIFIADDAVYLYCPDGYGSTKLSNNFLESKLNVAATTRNWKTVNEILRLARTGELKESA